VDVRVQTPLFFLGYFMWEGSSAYGASRGLMRVQRGVSGFWRRCGCRFIPGFSDLVHDISSAGELPRLRRASHRGGSEMDILLASVAGSSLLGIALGLIFPLPGLHGRGPTSRSPC
jgi:uncharacterized membrane-anchored protein YitT (DUF2179 family)